jgi:hypothetical protein
MLFDGIAGQMISIRGSSSSFGSCTLLLIDPYGNQLASTSCTGAISFLDAQLVRYSGTYTIGIDPNSSIGSLNLTVDGFVDQTANLVLGTPSGIAISSPGQKAIYSFSGVAGQQANVTVSDWTVSGCPTGSLTILRPDGSQLTFANLCNGAASTGATVLPTTGRYQAIFDPTGPNTGTAAINLALQ